MAALLVLLTVLVAIKFRLCELTSCSGTLRRTAHYPGVNYHAGPAAVSLNPLNHTPVGVSWRTLQGQREGSHTSLSCALLWADLQVCVDYLVTAWADPGYHASHRDACHTPATQDTRIRLPALSFPFRVSLSRRLRFYPRCLHFCVTLSQQQDGAELLEAGVELPSPTLQHCSSVGEGSVLRPSRPPSKLPFALHTVRIAKVVCHAKSSHRKEKKAWFSFEASQLVDSGIKQQMILFWWPSAFLSETFKSNSE